MLDAETWIDLAKWAIPFIVGYLVWVHRELVTLRNSHEQLSGRMRAHDDASATITAQLSEVKIMLGRLEERIEALLRKG